MRASGCSLFRALDRRPFHPPVYARKHNTSTTNPSKQSSPLVVQHNEFRSEFRSHALQQFIQRFQVQTFYHPNYLRQCGSSSVPSRISVEGYRLLMRECNKVRKPQLAMELFDEVARAELEQDDRILVQLFNALKLLMDKEQLHQYIERTRDSDRDFSEPVYQAIAGALCACDDFENAQQLADVVVDAVGPSVYLYNELIAAGDLKSSKQIFMDLRSDPSAKPNVASYNALIDRYGRAGKVQSAFTVFKQLEMDEIPPARSTFEILAKWLAHSSRDTQLLDTLVDRMRGYNIQPNAKIIEYLVLGYSRCGDIMKARKNFYMAIKFQYEQTGNVMRMITPDTYLALLEGYLLIENVDECEELIKEMGNSKMDTTLDQAYTRTIELCCQQDPHRAFSIFQKMKSDHIIPNAQNYNDLICSLSVDEARGYHVEKLKNLFAEATATNLDLDPLCYHRLLNLFIEESQWEFAAEIVRGMLGKLILLSRKAHERILSQQSEHFPPELLESIQRSFSLDR